MLKNEQKQTVLLLIMSLKTQKIKFFTLYFFELLRKLIGYNYIIMIVQKCKPFICIQQSKGRNKDKKLKKKLAILHKTLNVKILPLQ